MKNSTRFQKKQRRLAATVLVARAPAPKKRAKKSR
jgi:hypothetical protein